MKTLSQFIRFFAVGGVGLLVLLGVTYLLTDFLHWWYFFAYIVGTLISWTCIFVMNSLFTFSGHKKDGYARKYGLFIAMYIGAFVVNATLVYSLTSLGGVPYLFSITIATAVTTLITFSISKIFIFTYGHQD